MLVVTMSIFAFMLIYNFQRTHSPLVYGSLIYWQLADSIYISGLFSLLNFVVQLRGYRFPILLHVLKWQANLIGVDARHVFAIHAALIFTMFVVPWSFRQLLPSI